MRTLASMLALVLALLTGGVFETLAVALDGHGECVDGGGDAGGDCSPTCSNGFCCPARAAPVTRVQDNEVRVPRTVSYTAPKVLITEAASSDIFQPPRA